MAFSPLNKHSSPHYDFYSCSLTSLFRCLSYYIIFTLVPQAISHWAIRKFSQWPYSLLCFTDISSIQLITRPMPGSFVLRAQDLYIYVHVFQCGDHRHTLYYLFNFSNEEGGICYSHQLNTTPNNISLLTKVA